MIRSEKVFRADDGAILRAKIIRYDDGIFGATITPWRVVNGHDQAGTSVYEMDCPSREEVVARVERSAAARGLPVEIEG